MNPWFDWYLLLVNYFFFFLQIIFFFFHKTILINVHYKSQNQKLRNSSLIWYFFIVNFFFVPTKTNHFFSKVDQKKLQQKIKKMAIQTAGYFCFLTQGFIIYVIDGEKGSYYSLLLQFSSNPPWWLTSFVNHPYIQAENLNRAACISSKFSHLIWYNFADFG